VATTKIHLPKPIYGTVTAITGSTASVGTTYVAVGLPSGYYRISTYADTQVAGTGNIVTTIAWTDDVGSKTIQVPAQLDLTTGNAVSDSIFLRLNGSASVGFSTTYTSTGTYDIHVMLEYLQ
jgi:hypothetical protein